MAKELTILLKEALQEAAAVEKDGAAFIVMPDGTLKEASQMTDADWGQFPDEPVGEDLLETNALVGRLACFAANLSSYTTRLVKFEGRDHIVVPVVMLAEGVHKGSGGELYYPAAELGKFPTAWNGVPVPVFHPEENGSPVSCNSPELLESQSVGRVFNTRFADGKLQAELWIDIAKLDAVDPMLLQRINKREPIEVSTGLFLEVDNLVGEWNGEPYVGVVKNFRPDHLALLPSGQGACSLKDGCGIRVNKQNEGGNNVDKKAKIKFLIDNGCQCNAEQLDKVEDIILDNMVKTIQNQLAANKEIADKLAANDAKTKELEAEMAKLKETKPTDNQQQTPKTLEELVALASPELQGALNRAVARDRKLKADLVDQLAANQKAFTKEELEGKSLEELEKLAALAQTKGDFTLAGGAVNHQVIKEEPMVAPTFNFGK